jgi:hypothetical protein
MSNFITIIHIALLRPSAFADYLCRGSAAIARAGLVIFGALIVALSGAVLTIAQFVPLGSREVLASVIVAPLLCVFIISVMAAFSSRGRLSSRALFGFWFFHFMLTLTPPLALFMGFMLSSTPNLLQTALGSIVLLLFLGVWIGNAVTFGLLGGSRSDQARGVRYVIAAGAFVVANGLLWLPALRGTSVTMIVFTCAGLVIGVLRPISYIWQAPLSMALGLCGRAGIPARRLLPLHPTSYDDLCILPLPGLGSLLAQALTLDFESGVVWLLRAAKHPGLNEVAARLVDRVVRQGQQTYQLLLNLSRSDDGLALLRRSVDRTLYPHPLIIAYTAFASVSVPEMWSLVINRHREALATGQEFPTGRAVQTYLQTAADLLCADRWRSAMACLQALPLFDTNSAEPFEHSLAMLRSLAGECWPELASVRAAQLRKLHTALPALAGWPSFLSDVISEHLAFLCMIEQHSDDPPDNCAKTVRSPVSSIHS